jgi:predicted dehydrogenase
MSKRLNVGVFGLQRNWQRFREAVVSTESPVEVRSVYDPSAHRTKVVARDLQCEVAGSAEDLVANPEIDAVLLLDPAWHGLWPVERACLANKPVFCTSEFCRSAEPLQLSHATQPKLPIMVAMSAEFEPAILRLHEVLEQHLGPARVVALSTGVSRQSTAEQLLASSLLLQPLHICCALLSASPATVHTASPAGSGVVQVICGFSRGRVALVTLIAGSRQRTKIRVTTERGKAAAALPRRVCWIDVAGTHSERLRRASIASILLQRFTESVQTGQASRPSLQDAFRAAACLRAARESFVNGEPVPVGG